MVTAPPLLLLVLLMQEPRGPHQELCLAEFLHRVTQFRTAEVQGASSLGFRVWGLGLRAQGSGFRV